MKHRKRLLWATILTVIAVILALRLMPAQPPLTGTLLYVSEEHYDRTWYDNCTYRIIEQDIKSGTQTILHESSEPISLLRGPEQTVYAAQCGEGNLTRVWDARTGSTVWEGQLREEFDPQFDDLLAFSGDTLYYRLNLASEGVTWVTVYRQRMGERPEIFMQFEGDPSAEHYALSAEGSLAYARGCVYLRHKGEQIALGEGSFPFFGSSGELYFMQDDHLMRYDVNSGEISAVKTESSRTIGISEYHLYAAPSLSGPSEYLVYAWNMENAPSMPNPPAIEVLSLKDGSTYRFKEVEDVFQTEPVFAFLR